MQITKIHKTIISIVAVLLLLGIYIVADRRAKNSNPIVDSPTATSTTPNVTATSSSGKKIITQGNSSYTIEQVSLNEGKNFPKPIPDLNRTVTVSTSVAVAPETLAFSAQKIPVLQARLKKNLGDWSAWIDLGIYQKQAGDYLGAVISWQYAGRLAPTDYVSRGNLGNLYAYYLKDKVMAESYYKQAIAKGPTQTYLYVQLAEVYIDIFKDKVKALAIVNQGLLKIPNDPALLEFKTTL